MGLLKEILKTKSKCVSINALNPKIKFEFSFVAAIHFLQKQWGEVDKISSKFILCDHVRNSHDHSDHV